MSLSAIRAAVVGLFKPDTGAYPRTSVTYLGKETDAVVIQPLGLFAGPVAGGLAILMQQQGQESSKYALCMDPNGRFKGLVAGEVLVGSTVSGSYVKFLTDGAIQIVSANETISIAGNLSLAGDLSVDGDVTVTGDIDVTGDSTANDHISNGIAFSTHVHPENDSGGPTGPPQ